MNPIQPALCLSVCTCVHVKELATCETRCGPSLSFCCMLDRGQHFYAKIWDGDLLILDWLAHTQRLTQTHMNMEMKKEKMANSLTHGQIQNLCASHNKSANPCGCGFFLFPHTNTQTGRVAAALLHPHRVWNPLKPWQPNLCMLHWFSRVHLF